MENAVWKSVIFHFDYLLFVVCLENCLYFLSLDLDGKKINKAISSGYFPVNKCFWQKASRVSLEKKLCMSQQCVLRAHRANRILGFLQRNMSSRWGRWFPPSVLLSWDPMWSTESSIDVPSKKMWTSWSKSRGGPWRGSQGWKTSSMKTGTIETEEEKPLGRPGNSLLAPKGASKKEEEGLLTKACHYMW